jgi:hypothetical protein
LPSASGLAKALIDADLTSGSRVPVLDSCIHEAFRLRGTFMPVRVAMRDVDVTVARWALIDPPARIHTPAHYGGTTVSCVVCCDRLLRRNRDAWRGIVTMAWHW